jgi:hypothetical protein
MAYNPPAVAVCTPFGYPRASDNLQRSNILRGTLSLTYGAYYTVGGLGSNSFNVTTVAVSGSVSTLTYASLLGAAIQVGATVFIAGATHATNNGPWKVVTVTPTSATAGSFTIVNAAATAESSSTGSGSQALFAGTGIQIFASQGDLVSPITAWFQSVVASGYNYSYNRNNNTLQITVTGAALSGKNAELASSTLPSLSVLAQTAVTVNGTVATYTYSLTSGNPLFIGQSLVIAAMTHSSNNGTFIVTSLPSSTTFTVTNATALAESGSSGTANGFDQIEFEATFARDRAS